ncbi:DUF2855 family protein [Robiginitomaculum antarcticum]|uniref:DUF2855 family protein n=1 Tax=Robiginitomaculum antarcticum TaxID=437507 RepID=UPI00036EAFDA|nr:DUF2855 family protein [Robiginitomaculum antarcticum]
MGQTLLVKKDDFSDVSIVNYDEGDLVAGHIRVDIGPFALTANNVTYMVTGDQIGYWSVFDPAAYNLGGAGQGRMPVWGYGVVRESKYEGIKTGTHIYGFFPIAKSMDMEPGRLSAHGFTDMAAHRSGLHGLYSSYSFTDADPSYGVHENLQPVLRPLFTTSFLIDDFLADENFFNADQVLLLSASSKTALGTAYCLKARGEKPVIGLTSSGNKDFVDNTGFYDCGFTYDNIQSIDKNVKTVVVDMSGNMGVIRNLEAHFGNNLTYICRVGISHWQEAAKAPPKRTDTPTAFFFAPDRAKQRIGDWGQAGFAKNLGARWMPFLNSASAWLTVEKQVGIEAVLENYKDLLNGRSGPDKGYLFTL